MTHLRWNIFVTSVYLELNKSFLMQDSLMKITPLLEYKVPSKVKLEIDVNLNTNIVLVALILCHVLLYRAYRVHLNRVRNLDENDAARK